MPCLLGAITCHGSVRPELQHANRSPHAFTHKRQTFVHVQSETQRSDQKQG